MAKARAVGSDAVQLISDEAAYGTARDGSGGGVYTRLIMKSSDLGGSQGLEADELWNQGSAEDSDPSLGAFDVSGDIAMPMCSRAVGFALSMALGVEDAPTDHMDGTYTHTWKSIKDLKSYSVQTGHPKLTTPKWRTALGAKAGGLQFPFQRNGRALMTLPMIAQSEVKDVAGARDAAPKVFAYKPFDNATGYVKIGGVALANMTGGQFNFSNGLEATETIRADMFIDGVDETIRTLSGQANLRLGTDHTIDDLVAANGSAALEFGFSLRGAPTWALKFIVPRVFFELPKNPITGPGGISATVNWRAARDATAGYMLEATLLNDVAAY